jgi:hypothetical protein
MQIAVRPQSVPVGYKPACRPVTSSSLRLRVNLDSGPCARERLNSVSVAVLAVVAASIHLGFRCARHAL